MLKRPILIVGVLCAAIAVSSLLGYDRLEDVFEGPVSAAASPLCSGGPGAATAQRSAATLPSFAHVVVIVMENKDCRDVAGNHDAPYLNGLSTRYATATRWYAIRHPSLPNYLAMIGGSTFGIHSDCTSCDGIRAPNLTDQLETAGISWKAYMEGMPSACFRGKDAGRYAKKHNPFVYFASVTDSPDRCRNVVPLQQLSTDLAAHRLPRFAFISPDLCHDTHDCSVADGDAWLRGVVPRILASLGSNGILVITYDEADHHSSAGCCQKAAGGQVLTVIAGPKVKRGYRLRLAYDHYSLLRTIEDAWRLPRLGDAACSCTRTISRLAFRP